MQLPPVRASGGDAHMESEAWLPQTSAARQEQHGAHMLGGAGASSAVPGAPSTAGQAWGHHAGTPDMDLNRQRILLAAHERAVDLMQRRQAWQAGQVCAHFQLLTDRPSTRRVVKHASYP